MADLKRLQNLWKSFNKTNIISKKIIKEVLASFAQIIRGQTRYKKIKQETESNIYEVVLNSIPNYFSFPYSQKVGSVFVDQSVPEDMSDLESSLSITKEYGGLVQNGGWWTPQSCKPRKKVR